MAFTTLSGVSEANTPIELILEPKAIVVPAKTTTATTKARKLLGAFTLLTPSSGVK
jgi:hypothetical protein